MSRKEVFEEQEKIIEYIKIVFCPKGTPESQEMEDEGHVAEISYKCSKLHGKAVTEIKLREEARVEDLAHELWHFLQYHMEEKGYKFKNGEEIAFLLEDTIRVYIRKILYPELR